MIMMIDDPTFDAVKYFAKLVKEQPLNGLIKSDNVIMSGMYTCVLKAEETMTHLNLFLVEMREIDGDMKTLVYENYSKFISATDTIRKVSEATGREFYRGA
jgi:hypothetical protein